MANYKALNTIRVLTFNVFENGRACCGSLHGSLKPRLSLVSYLVSYPLTFLQRHRRFVLTICVRHTVLLVCFRSEYLQTVGFSVGL